MFVLSWHSDLSAVISHSASLSHTLTHIHEQTPEDVTGFFFRTQCALYFWFEFYALVSDSECIYENFQFPSNFITLWRCMCGAADDDDTWIASRPPQPLRLVNNNSYIQMTSVLFFLFFFLYSALCAHSKLQTLPIFVFFFLFFHSVLYVALHPCRCAIVLIFSARF